MSLSSAQRTEHGRSGVDLTALAWCLGEIRASLVRAVDCLRDGLGDEAQVALHARSAAQSLHQAIGALRFVQLEEVARVLQQIERLAGSVERGDRGLDATGLSVIERAVAATLEWLELAASGEPVSAVGLFAQYRELRELRGAERIEPSDLFEVSLIRGAPEDLELQALSDRHAAAVQGAFERGLLGFLRDPRDEASLRAMLTGLQRMARVPASPQERDTWWLAAAFIDALRAGSLPVDLTAKRQVARVAQVLRKRLRQVRDPQQTHAPQQSHALMPGAQASGPAQAPSLPPGDSADWQRLQRELLFLLASSGPGSALADAVRADNHLEGRVPPGYDTPRFGLVEGRVRIQAIEAVAQVKACWEVVAGGGLHELGAFGAALQRLDAVLARMPHAGLQTLPAAMLALRRWLGELDEAPAEPVAMEVATCLLFIELALKPGTLPSGEMDARAAQMRTRIEGLSAQASSPEPLPGWLHALGQSAQEQSARQSLVDELQANLRSCEQTLDGFFKEPSQREGLAQTQALLMQVAGAMRLLGHRDAVDGAQSIARRVASFITEETAPGASECELVAAQLGALGFFAESLRQPEAIAPGFEFHNDDGRFTAVLRRPGQGTSLPAVADEGTIELASPGLDMELLGVFLAEARDVLSALRGHVLALRESAADPLALIGARRSVHTLKGSSRMVGLSDLGQVAWAWEEALNGWLALGQPVEPRLCDGLEDFIVQFDAWVDLLGLDPSASIEAQAWIDRARDLHPAIAIAIQDASPPESTQDEDLLIGNRSLSASLYRLFLDEADQLLAVLEKACHGIQQCPGDPVSAEGVRAAHSLAGSARLVGLDEVGQAARDLEHCFESQAQSLLSWEPLDAQESRLLLDRMQAALHQFAAGRQPETDAVMTDLARRLSDRWKSPSRPEVPTEVHPEGHTEGHTETHIEAQIPGPVAAALEAPLDIPLDTPVVDEVVDEIVDEVDPDLLPIFLEEARALMPQVDNALHHWQSEPGQTHWAASLMRWMHTLKGSARMAGAMRLGQAVHEMESRIEQQMAAADLAQEVPLEDLRALIAELIERQDQASTMVDALSGVERPALPADESQPPTMDLAPASGVEAAPVQAQAASPLVRVRADLLDRLVNEAGEVAIARARLDGELSGVHAALADLTDNVARLRGQLREIQLAADTRINTRRDLQSASPDFDPLEFDRYTRFQELTRQLAESVDDVATVHHNAVRGLEQATRDLHLQAQVTRDLQQDLMTIRMVRFASIAARLHRVVRQAGRDTGRQARLDMDGERVELDRSVLERVLGPLEHLLRNAVAHGVESPEVRREAGKPEQGVLRLSVRAEGRTIAIELADDGRGLDLEKIRERALERGLIVPGTRLGEPELAQLIFLPGFTTADQVSAVAGRGVGLDVVRAEVAAMGGRIEVNSIPGQGARFSMHLPASMAMSQVMLVRVGDRRFAIGSGVIEQLLQPDPDRLNEAHAHASLELEDGSSVPLAYLGGLVDLSIDPEGQRHPPVLLLRSGHQRLALHVDEVSPVQDVVVKDVGAQLSRMPGIVGATVLGQGDIVLIIDPVQIDLAVRRSSEGRSVPTIVQPARMVLAPTVMVVDDSVTVRKVTQRLLQREGYTVMLARDGLDALQQLEDTLPDILLLDIEMPRMDGFELVARLRDNARLATIPVVMISSRTAQKHREHAAALGVQAFLGKPYDESELLGLIARLTTS